MATFSKTELATRVLKDLGLVSAEETPSAADIAFAIQTADSEIALMATDDIRIWNGSSTTIPIEYLTALSRRIGLAVGPGFGLFTIVDAEKAIPLANDILRSLSNLSNPPTPARIPNITGSNRANFNFTTGL